MASFPSREIQRTPLKGASDPNPLNLPSNVEGVTTRSASGKAQYRYVENDGESPSETLWQNYIVKLDASVTQLEGPVFGIIGEPVSVQPKGKKKQSQREGYYVREIFHDSVGTEAYLVERSNIECVTKICHVAHLDNLLFRVGRKVDYEGKLQYCQIVDVDTNANGDPAGLVGINRGDEPTLENRYHVDVEDFKVCTMIEYMTNYGSGETKSKWKKVNQTGSLLAENLTSSTELKQYQGRSKVFCKIDCDMGEELPYLSEIGDYTQITPEEYLETEAYEPTVEEKPPVKTKKGVTVKKESITVKAKKVKVKKELFLEQELDSESEDDDPDPDGPDIPDEIEDFVISPVVAKAPTASNKYGLVVTDLRRERHQAIFNKSFMEGKWKLMSIEAKAEKMYRMESKRGRYNNTRTVFQIWFFGNIGEDPMAYFMPYEKVPLSEVQGIPNAKWTTSVEPTKWIRSMKQLSECLNILSEIAHEYYRYDVFMAIEAIAKKAHLMHDMDLAMAGVNAYRDLYEGALGAIVDGAVDGFKGDLLLRIALGEVHPSSKAYSDIISDRLLRVNAGAQWGKASSGTVGGGKNYKGDGNGGKGDKGDKDKSEKPKGMSDAQKELVPSVNGRKVCLAYMSIRDCKRKDCLFLHDASPEVPEGLRGYFRKRFGAPKPSQQ